MKHKALKKIEGGKSTQRVNIQKQKEFELEQIKNLLWHLIQTGMIGLS